MFTPLLAQIKSSCAMRQCATILLKARHNKRYSLHNHWHSLAQIAQNNQAASREMSGQTTLRPTSIKVELSHVQN